MTLEIKDLKSLDHLAEALGALSRENDFAIHIFENIENATEEEQNAYWELIAKRKRIDDLMDQIRKLISENMPPVKYVKYKRKEST